MYSSNDREQWLNMACGSIISVSKNQLITQAVELCSILKYEYILAPVNIIWYDNIMKRVYLVSSKYFF